MFLFVIHLLSIWLPGLFALPLFFGWNNLCLFPDPTLKLLLWLLSWFPYLQPLICLS